MPIVSEQIVNDLEGCSLVLNKTILRIGSAMVITLYTLGDSNEGSTPFQFTDIFCIHHVLREYNIV